ncbi:ferredoxin [Gordonia sp. NPDC058843]|uniref:ferredoxin n=1 Tax=Gordonia sp. NPDC058843 TaxID=3346648 RepID=UPI00367FBA5C
MTYVVTNACVDVKDKSCIEECPVDCIYEGDRMMYIHPDECIDCGACAPVCPQDAIFFDAELAPESVQYIGVNAQFFDTLGSPQGAEDVGPIAFDHPTVAALPARTAD